MLTTGNQTTGSLRVYIESVAVRQFKKSVYFYDLLEKKSLKTGDHVYTLNVPQRTSFTSTTATIVEGVTPNEMAFKYDQVAVTCTQYGAYVKITDIADKDSVFDLYTEAGYELGRQMAEVADQVIQNELLTNGTYVTYGSGNGAITARANITATSYVVSKDLADIFALLRAKAAPMLDGNAYAGVFHPFVVNDIRKDGTANAAWFDAVKYTMPEKILNGEVGKMHGIRIMESANISTFLGGVGGTVKIYPSYIVGDKAYAVVESQPLETIIKSNTSGGSENPLNLVGSVGLKIRFGIKIVKQEALMRLEGASSLSAQTLPY